ncbi:hypothetical protein [Actinoplanes sp. NPDC051859]|uniref:hypothetical protein n=1 Tax=Actinoplanes sp. NPDC051859 TaxID=3363909 RepID=UPI0037AF52E9
MMSSAEVIHAGRHRLKDVRAVLDQRIPGAHLPRMLKQRAIGVARVLPIGAALDEHLSLDKLKRLAAGIRRIGEDLE